MKTELPFKAIGRSGNLIIEENKVIIERSSLLSQSVFGKTNKEFYLHSITGLNIRWPNFLMNGYFQILAKGTSEKKGRTSDIALDENTIIFKKIHVPQFQIAKSIIDSLLQKKETSPAPLQNTFSNIEQIEKLHELMEKGVITKDEFELKKKELLK